MNEFVKILLSLSVSGTLLLLLILGLKPLYKNRFSRRTSPNVPVPVNPGNNNAEPIQTNQK